VYDRTPPLKWWKYGDKKKKTISGPVTLKKKNANAFRVFNLRSGTKLSREFFEFLKSDASLVTNGIFRSTNSDWTELPF
jgi:hypothetical protein